MLTINFAQVKNSTAPLTSIDCMAEIRPAFLQRSQKLIYEVKGIHVTGAAFYNEPYVTGDFHVEADLVVPSSRSLKPVTLREDFHFSENYTDEAIPTRETDDSAVPVVQAANDLIDLQTAVEDNILLHIPTTVLTQKEEQQGIYPRGTGWSVVSESEFAEGKKNQVNPAFAKLKELFDTPSGDDGSQKK